MPVVSAPGRNVERRPVDLAVDHRRQAVLDRARHRSVGTGRRVRARRICRVPGEITRDASEVVGSFAEPRVSPAQDSEKVLCTSLDPKVVRDERKEVRPVDPVARGDQVALVRAVGADGVPGDPDVAGDETV